MVAWTLVLIGWAFAAGMMAFYAAGAPKLEEHGMFNESKDASATYLAIGVPVGGANRGGGTRAGAGAARGAASQPGR